MPKETIMLMNVEGKTPFLTLNTWEKGQRGYLAVVASIATRRDGEVKTNFSLIVDGDLTDVRDRAVRESRIRGIAYTEISRTLLEEVLNTKAADAEFDKVPQPVTA